MSEEENVVDQVRSFVEGCLTGARLDLECECQGQEEMINVLLSGADSGLVLRDNARLLYGLNHLLNQVYYRRTGSRYSFIVDCEDYRGTSLQQTSSHLPC